MNEILPWGAVAALVGLYAYSKGWILANFKSITPLEAHELLKDTKGTALLDVRTPMEYKQESIKGAILIPLHELRENLSKLEKVKDKQIVVYCRSGNRSVTASRILAKNGFLPLNVKGGINRWKNLGIELH